MSELNTSQDDFGKRLRRVEDRMDKLERLIASLATKDDIKTLRTDMNNGFVEIRSDIDKTKNELKDELAGVEDSLGRKIDNTRKALKGGGFNPNHAKEGE